VRVIHPPGQVIGEHRHDWPFLMLPTLGDCVERHEAGEVRIGSPSAVMHPAGTCHANCIGRHGMESVSIEFDPDWVRTAGLGTALQRSRSWVGGSVALAARSVTLAWENTGASEREVARATGAFLRLALAHEAHARPRWLAAVQAMLDADDAPPTGEIARRLSLHPAWLARSYRRAVGEGLHATVRRKRVERAMLQLRWVPTPHRRTSPWRAGFATRAT